MRCILLQLAKTERIQTKVHKSISRAPNQRLSFYPKVFIKANLCLFDRKSVYAQAKKNPVWSRAVADNVVATVTLVVAVVVIVNKTKTITAKNKMQMHAQRLSQRNLPVGPASLELMGFSSRLSLGSTSARS